MKKYIILMYVLLLSVTLQAQQASIAVGCRQTEQHKLSVQLKFLFKDKTISDKSLNVYRRQTTASDWEKINRVPIVKSSTTEGYNDDAYKSYLGFMTRKRSSKSADDDMAIGIFGLMMIDDNGLAKYAGCYFEDSSAIAGNTYIYRITDVAAADKEVAVSAAFTVKENYLNTVKKITAVQDVQNGNIDWEMQDAFIFYNVYRSPDPTSKPGKLNNYGLLLSKKTNKRVAMYIDSMLQTGRSYYYRITGIDLLGNESSLSDAVKLDVRDLTSPEPVTKFGVKKVGTSAVLNWRPSVSGDAKSYNVYRSNVADSQFKKIAVLPDAKVALYIDKDLPDGGGYSYIVECMDNAGNTAKSQAMKVYFPDKTPPAKPVGLKAVTKPGVVQLTWEKNKEADLKGYYIFRASNRNKDYFNMIYKEPIRLNLFVDSLPGVSKNEYVYYIQAVDVNFNVSEPSDTLITRLPDTLAPHAPVIKSIAYAGDTVKLIWGATDNDIVSFDVYRSDDSVARASFKKINTQPISGKYYADKITIKSKGYHYYVKAKDNAGNTSVHSPVRSVFVEADTVVRIPANTVTANFNITDTTVALKWANPAKNLQGYMIMRRDEGETEFRYITRPFNENLYIDKNITPGKTYQYRVRSFFTGTREYADAAVASIKAK